MTSTTTEPEETIRAHLDEGALESAATAALTAYGPEILGFLIAVERDEADGSEIFGQFCDDLWRGLPSFGGESSVRTWAYRLAHNATHRFRRDPDRPRGLALEQHPELEEVATRVRTSTLEYLHSAGRDGVAELREELPKDDHALLVLRIDRQLAWAEIARILGPEGPSDRELQRVSAELRETFERLKRQLLRRALERGLLS